MRFVSVGTVVIVGEISKRIIELYGEGIMQYCKGKKYDSDRIITSLAARSYKRLK